MHRTRQACMLAAGVVLTIEAAPTVGWSLSCVAGDERLELRGSGPIEQAFARGPANCRVTLEAGEAPLAATLTDGSGNRSRSQVSGVGSIMHLRSS